VGCKEIEWAANEAIDYGICILADGASPVERLMGPAGKDLLYKAEQYVIDAMKDAGYNLKNSRNAISTTRGRLRDDFLKFCK